LPFSNHDRKAGVLPLFSFCYLEVIDDNLKWLLFHYSYPCVFTLPNTARDLLQKIAEETGLSYGELANRVNTAMHQGQDFVESVELVLKEEGLPVNKYRLRPKAIAQEIDSILNQDYSQTVMISAVLARMAASDDEPNFPMPAFFAFLEFLADIEEPPEDEKKESANEIEEHTTRLIELLTTLVSLICSWSNGMIAGVSKECPDSLTETAKIIFRRDRLYRAGLWICISCGKIVDFSETSGLMCSKCSSGLGESFLDSNMEEDERFERTRTGYGKTKREDLLK
jgi:hypothetical protein